MRLTPHQIENILSTAKRLAGDSAAVYLFGSRTDDRARGGDVDLLIETPAGLDLLVRAHLKMELETQLGLPVDILAQTPTKVPTAFQVIARAGAIRLEADKWQESIADWQLCRATRNLAAHEYDTDYATIAEHFNALDGLLPSLYANAGRFLAYCREDLSILPLEGDFQAEFDSIIANSERPESPHP